MGNETVLEFYHSAPVQGPFCLDEEKLVDALVEGKLCSPDSLGLLRGEARVVAQKMIEAARPLWR